MVRGLNALLFVGIFLGLAAACGEKLADDTTSSPHAIIGENGMVSVARDLSNLPEKARKLVGAIGLSNDKCTVFHLGHGLAVTAAHCVTAPASDSNTPCQTMSIAWGAHASEGPSLQSRCLRIEAYRFANGQDYAFIIVDPKPDVAFELADVAAPGNQLAVIGYPNKEPLAWSSDCTSIGNLASQNVRFQHNCDTLPGNSGSPVLLLPDFTVAGIHSGGDSINYGTLMSATPAKALLEAAEAMAYRRDVPGAAVPLNFGPFGANENRLLATVPSGLARFVTMTVKVDVEDTYDRVSISDGFGRIRDVSGNREVTLSHLPTPVTVVFISDYAGISNSVNIRDLELLND